VILIHRISVGFLFFGYPFSSLGYCLALKMEAVPKKCVSYPWIRLSDSSKYETVANLFVLSVVQFTFMLPKAETAIQ
jgi:hypothetical protein